MIVSESLARQLNGQALGAKLFFGSLPHLVVGVVGDVKQENYRDDDLPAVYIPPNTFDTVESLILRFSPGATVSAAAIRQAVQEYDPTIVVTAVHPVASLLERSLAAEVLRARSAVLFGSAAVFLGLAGLYATGRRAADQRRKECAVRLALGAGTRGYCPTVGSGCACLGGHWPRHRGATRADRRVRTSSRLVRCLRDATSCPGSRRGMLVRHSRYRDGSADLANGAD